MLAPFSHPPPSAPRPVGRRRRLPPEPRQDQQHLVPRRLTAILNDTVTTRAPGSPDTHRTMTRGDRRHRARLHEHPMPRGGLARTYQPSRSGRSARRGASRRTPGRSQCSPLHVHSFSTCRVNERRVDALLRQSRCPPWRRPRDNGPIAQGGPGTSASNSCRHASGRATAVPQDTQNQT